MPQLVSAYSPNFTISDPDSVTLDSPNSGSFAHDQSISISWTKTNFTNNIDLYWTTSTTFSTSNNIVFNYNANSYSWNIPSSISGQSIYIWVRKTGDSAVKDRSNNAITITGITLARSINETLSSSDAFTFSTGQWKKVLNLSDTLSTSDSFTQATHEYIKFRNINEALTPSDSFTQQQRVFIEFANINETLATSDSFTAPTRKWILERSLADTLTGSDSFSFVERLWIKVKALADTLATSDSFTTASRQFIKLLNLNDTLNTAESNSLGRLVNPTDIVAVTDSFTTLVSKQGSVYQLDGNSSNEQITALYRTGWIMPNNLDKNAIIRRVNLDYTSDSAVTIKIFKDDDIVTPFATKTLNASSTPAHGSIRLGTRIKYFLIAIETTQSANENVRIERIEIEVDD